MISGQSDTARPDVTRHRRLEAIRKASAELFAERGYDAVNLVAIARAVDLPSQLVINYAGSKDEIYLDCHRRARQELLDRLDEAGDAVAARGAHAQLVAGLDVYFDFVATNAEAWSLIRQRGSAGEPLFAKELAKSRADLARLLAQVLAEARRAVGRDDDVGTEFAAHTILGAVEGAAEWWLETHEGGRAARMAIVDQLASVLWTGLKNLP